MSASPADPDSSRGPGLPAGPAGSDNAARVGAPGRARVPTWVLVFGVIGLLVVILVVVMLLVGHRPGRHTDAGLPLGFPVVVPAGDGGR